MAMPLTVPRYTVDQIKAFPPDGNRYELLDGVLLVTPAPRLLHQVVVSNLLAALHHTLRPFDRARVVSVGELEIGEHTLLNPDILVIPARFGVDANWEQIHDWWLAVEVLSPSTRVYDHDFKRQAYQAIGVEEVWLVDPGRRQVEVWRGTNPASTVVHGTLHWHPAGLQEARTVNLDDIFGVGG
jgi:Uma2 family endonuclease